MLLIGMNGPVTCENCTMIVKHIALVTCPLPGYCTEESRNRD